MDTDGPDPLFSALPAPTAARPLLGLTVLVIEDSRYACDALRLLCLRSGARIRRADSLRSARRHLRTYRPSVAIVDLGLPDGSGTDLIAELLASNPRPEVVLGMSGDTNGETKALDAGADAFLPKPVVNLAQFQEAILRLLPPARRPSGLRAVPHEDVSPDPIAYRDDMAHAADVIDSCDDDTTLDYIAQFLRGVASSAKDDALAGAAAALHGKRLSGDHKPVELDHVSSLVRERLGTRVAI